MTTEHNIHHLNEFNPDELEDWLREMAAEGFAATTCLHAWHGSDENHIAVRLVHERYTDEFLVIPKDAVDQTPCACCGEPVGYDHWAFFIGDILTTRETDKAHSRRVTGDAMISAGLWDKEYRQGLEAPYRFNRN